MSSHRDIQKHKKHARSQKRYEASWGGEKGQKKKKARDFKLLMARAKDDMVRTIREIEDREFLKLLYGNPSDVKDPVIQFHETEKCREITIVREPKIKIPYATITCNITI